MYSGGPKPANYLEDAVHLLRKPAASNPVPGRGETVSLFQVYARALQYLAVHKFRVSAIVLANVVLAIITIAEPILFGRIIDAISSKGEVTPMLLMWAGLGVFNTVAFVLVARDTPNACHPACT